MNLVYRTGTAVLSLLIAAACAKGKASPPTASAGAAQSVNAGTVVHLDGSASTDPHGKALGFAWSLDVVPAGSKAALDDVHALRPSFTADLPGRYVAGLVVSNGSASAASSVEIQVSTCGAGIPVVGAVTASSTHAIAATRISLAASGVRHPDNDPGCALNKQVSYSWNLERPAGSDSALDSLSSKTPGFSPDIEGNYVATLVVKDADGRVSKQARVAIVVANPSAAKSSIGISDGPVRADGVSHATMTVKVIDSTGFALAGLPVQVTGDGAILTDLTARQPPSSASGTGTLAVSTNATGDLTIGVASTVAGIIPVTVRVNGGAAPLGFVFPVTPRANFVGGPVARLVFTAQPTDTTPGATLSAVTVTAYDLEGNVASTTPADITIALSTNNGRPAPGTLSGTLTISTGTSGTATFSDLSIDNPAGPPATTTGGYALTASASVAGVAPVISVTFNSIPPVPQPATSLTAQGASTASVAFAWTAPQTTAWIASYSITDSSGAVLFTVPASSNTATINAAPGALASYTLVTNDVLGRPSVNNPGVTAKPLPSAPGSLSATVDSTRNSVALAWTAPGDCCAASYAVSLNGAVVTSVTGTSASILNLAPGTYSISVVTIDSLGQSSAAATAPAVVNAPAIQGFSAAKATLTTGSSTTLTATFTDGTGQIDPGAIPVTSGQPVSTGALTATANYMLTVKDSAGTSVTASVTVTVVPAATIASFDASPWPVIASGTAARLTPVFANGTGAVDQGVGAVTSGQAVTTANLTTATSYTLTVTNPAGDSVSRKTTIYPTSVQPIFGAPGSPGASCRQILDAGTSYGDGLYSLDPDQTGTAFQAFCDMTLDGGGFTVFYAGLNGSPNAFSNFSTAAADCSDPRNHCMRRLPASLGRNADIAATCGTHALKTVVDGLGFGYLQRGIARNSWNTMSSPVSLAAGTNLTNVTNFYLGGNGFILGSPGNNPSTFLSAFTGDTTWNYCNGSPDTVSTIRLLSRETTAASFSLMVPSQSVVSTATSFVISALDAGGRLVKGYRGTVHLTSSDGTAIPDYTFTAADGGTHRITGVTFATTGTKTISVTDAYKASLTGSGTEVVGTTAIGSSTTAGSAAALSCLDVLLSGSSTGTGKYQLKPAGVATAFTAYCDMDFNGGGWTLTLSTRNGQGPASAATGVVDPASGVTQAMPLATFTALSNGSREVHMRTAGQAATQSITSYPLTVPIFNLRSQLSLVAKFAEISDSDYYGPYATPDHIDSTCANTQGPFPSLYQACGTNGIHLEGTSSRWNWNSGNNATNVSMEFYLR